MTLLRCGASAVLKLRDQAAYRWNQFPAMFDGTDQRTEVENEEMADAKFVVVAEHFGDLLRRIRRQRL